jgi:hypothetical protein
VSCVKIRKRRILKKLERITMRLKSNSLAAQITKNVKINYLLSFPEGYEEEHIGKWGLIVFLHGMDMRGEDVSKLNNYGIFGIGKGLSLPFVVAVPQCPSESYWNMERDAVMALDILLKILRQSLENQRWRSANEEYRLLVSTNVRAQFAQVSIGSSTAKGGGTCSLLSISR